MSIRRILYCLLAGALISASVSAAQRNVVLFVTDDLSPDAGCYGNPVIQTPNLDRLAAEGTRCDYAFCTTASCSASRSVILTGLFNHANAQYGHQHSYHHFSSYDWVQSLPVLMSRAGYRTARVGKFHVAPDEVFRFDVVIPGPSRNPVAMAENCRRFVLRAAEDRPFFLYFCTADPHRGGGAAEELPHKPDRFGNKPAGGTYPGVTEVRYDPKAVIVPPFLPDTPTCRAELAQYYQSASRVDQGLGRLIEILREADVYDDTLLIFTSDHGMAFPGAKTTVYDAGLHVPLVVRNPYQNPRPAVFDGMISLVDLTPTILDFAGVVDHETGAVRADSATARPGSGQKPPQPYRFHGRSFLSALQQDDTEEWGEIYASHTFHEITMYYPMRVVRTRQYKLIWNIAHPLPFPFASDLWVAPTWQDRYQQGMDTYYGKRTVGQYLHRPKFELFDLESDPHEAHNLADDPDHARVLEELKGKLRAFQQRTDDPWILKWEYE